MAITQNTYTGDGATVLFSFTFPYLQEADIKITLDGTPTTAYTLANPTTIQFNTAPGNNVAIRIYRDTDIDTLSAEFFPGSAIRAEDLNNNYTQNNYAVQEAKREADAAVTTSDSALSIVNSVVSYDPVVNVAAIPAAPSDGDRIEVLDSTGIESYTPLSGVPGGFIGASTLTVRLIYSVTTWVWQDYQSTDPDARYLKVNGDSTMTGNLVMGTNSITGLVDPTSAQEAATKNYVDTNYLSQSDASTTYLTQSNAASTYMPLAGGTFTGDVTIPDKIIHAGDPDTTIRFSNADTVAIETGGVENVEFGTSEVVFNDGGGNIDFRIEGDTEANLFFVDAGTDTVSFRDNVYVDGSGRLLVGTSSSRSAGNERIILSETTDNTAGISLVRNSNDSDGPAIALAKSRGTTVGSSTIVQNNDSLGEILFLGANGTDINTAGASIRGEVDGAAGPFSVLGRLVFSVTPFGGTTPGEAMRINNFGELLVGYTTSNGGYNLQVNSQIFATSATIATSDGRYKENVASLDGCLDLVKALRPVSFTWEQQEDITRLDNDGNEVLVREGHNFPEGTQVGFIAQEVQEVLADKPWLGSIIKENVRPAIKDNEGNELAPEEQFFGIAEGNLIAVLTNALQEAIAKIETLEAKVAALEAQ